MALSEPLPSGTVTLFFTDIEVVRLRKVKRSYLLKKEPGSLNIGFGKYPAALLALALCTACGGALPFNSAQAEVAQDDTVAPATVSVKYIGRTLFANGRPLTAARPPFSPLPRFETILPYPRAKSRKRFEYVINTYGSYASIFDYPKSDKQIGTIENVGGQGCTNALYGYGRKIIWIVAASNAINEYEVPDKLIKSLSVSPSWFPTSCAMNSTGDLAVGIFGSAGGGDVVIFKNASGSGTIYETPLDSEFFDGYDPQGNLFADGYTRSGFGLVELPKGSSKFRLITIPNTVQFPGSVQWDGKYVVVFDQVADTFYQYTISGTTAMLKGTVSITGTEDCAQTWIVKEGGGLVFCGGTTTSGDANPVFAYPAGGAPVALLTGNFVSPLGVTVSRK